MRSRFLVPALVVVAATTSLSVAPAVADPASCDVPSCVPGIKGGVELGAPCDNTTYYVYGTTSWGRLVFCGSPRRYAPRYFRSPPMMGVKDENSPCHSMDFSVAQSPEGLFLSCVDANGSATWVRGDT